MVKYQYVAKYGDGLALGVLYLEMQVLIDGTWLGLGDGNLISNCRSLQTYMYLEDLPTLLD